MPFVYSTGTCSTTYNIFEDTNAKDISRVKHAILIKGGANVANKHIVTPRGVVTEVSDSDLALLMKDPHFQQHMKAGFLSVEDHKVSANKVAKDMEPKDKSAPRTPEDPEFQGTTKVLGSDTPKRRR